MKAAMSPHRRGVLASKRLRLFHWILQDIHHGDKSLVQDVSQGFSLIGRLPSSNVFKTKFKPASVTEAMLRAGAERARDALMATVRSSGDPDVDEGVLKATEKEVELGYVEGPISMADVPPCATVTRRFGVRQGEALEGDPKIRPIDDYKAWMVNGAVTQSEQVPVHTLDAIAAMLSFWMAESKTREKPPSLVSKCWDLKGAYKQLPLRDSAYEMDSFFVIFHPGLQGGAVLLDISP